MGIENEIERLIERRDTDEEILVSNAYADEGTDLLFPRLARAAGNQASGSAATFSRYAFWANTVRDNLRAALEELKAGNHDQVRRQIRRSVMPCPHSPKYRRSWPRWSRQKPQGSRRNV